MGRAHNIIRNILLFCQYSLGRVSGMKVHRIGVVNWRTGKTLSAASACQAIDRYSPGSRDHRHGYPRFFKTENKNKYHQIFHSSLAAPQTEELCTNKVWGEEEDAKWGGKRENHGELVERDEARDQCQVWEHPFPEVQRIETFKNQQHLSCIPTDWKCGFYK